ncbi:MAG: WG repeat-containing protein [Candidatus Obscuribacter phosphatis]|uniref:WG repeat-containing protein n=1 Tax=Candidatus Obscuribacter phosphatis TaxID=1906157 RepID=A0A8J7TK59_9BACT|nr:WG repeat-containing protein [Candidatus Obscuribacter phosphatis]
MKLVLVFCLLFFWYSSVTALLRVPYALYSANENLYAYKRIDGQFLTPFIYDRADKFSKGFAHVCRSEFILPLGPLGISRLGPMRHGFVDSSGRFLYRTGKELEDDASEDLAIFSDVRKVGFIDRDGDVRIAPNFDHARPFCDGLAAVCRCSSNHIDGPLCSEIFGKWGFVDKSGTLVIPYRFASVADFSEGLAAFQFEGRYGFIDKTGAVVIAAKYKKHEAFSNGYARTDLGFIDKGGALKFPADWSDITSFSENRCTWRKDGKYYLLDEKFRTVSEGFDRLGNVHEGLCYFQKDGLFGYIDQNGRVIVTPQYLEAGQFCSGMALVKSKSGVLQSIDKLGRVLATVDDAKAENISENIYAVSDKALGYRHAFDLFLTIQPVLLALLTGFCIAIFCQVVRSRALKICMIFFLLAQTALLSYPSGHSHITTQLLWWCNGVGLFLPLLVLYLFQRPEIKARIAAIIARLG